MKKNYPTDKHFCSFKCTWFLFSVPLCTLFPLFRPQWEHLLPTLLSAILDPSCGGAKFRHVNWDITCPPPKNLNLAHFFPRWRMSEKVWRGELCELEMGILSAKQSLMFPETSTSEFAVYSPSQVFLSLCLHQGTCSFFQLVYTFWSFHPRPTLPFLCLVPASAVGYDVKWGHILIFLC